MMPYTGPKEYKPLSPWAYWGLSLLYTVPVVGLVFMIVFSFNKNNIHRRNFTRSYWINLLIAVVLIGVLLAIGVATGTVPEVVSKLQEALASV